MGFLDKLLGRTQQVAGDVMEKAGDVAGDALDKGEEVAGEMADKGRELLDRDKPDAGSSGTGT